MPDGEKALKKDALVEKESKVEKGLKDNNGEKEKKKMSPLTKEILKCVIVLTAIALVAGLLLGVVNYFTYVDPDVVMQNKIEKTLYAGVGDLTVSKDGKRVVNQSGSKSFVDSCFTVKFKDNSESFVYLATGAGAYKGTVQLIIAVKDSKVEKISVYKHSETNGVGSKILAQDNLNKYVGTDISKMTKYNAVGGKDAKGDKIYISGATKTTTGVLNALRAVAYSYNEYKEVKGE